MFSCLQILEAFLWFVLITLLNVTLIILTLSVSRQIGGASCRDSVCILSCGLLFSCSYQYLSLVFFYTQKTSYDIVLVIPAEPLFRSKADGIGSNLSRK